MLHQIQVAIYHPEVSRKALLSVLDSKMTRFGAMLRQIQVAIYHPEGSQNGVPKSVTLFGVPVFGPVLPRSSCNLPQNMVPGPKSTFWTMLHDFQVTIYHIRWSFFNLFLFGVTFWTPSDGKTYRGDRAHMSKKWSQSKR